MYENKSQYITLNRKKIFPPIISEQKEIPKHISVVLRDSLKQKINFERSHKELTTELESETVF